jgi:type II secretory ATPase GspE/PulE/Tfp pilus assembly ATPase PilB-like protein
VEYAVDSESIPIRDEREIAACEGLFSYIPKDCRNQVAIIEGTIHLSEILRSPENLGILSIIAQKASKSGLSRELIFHPPSEFMELYEKKSVLSFHGEKNQSRIIAHAKMLIAEAYQLCASDIHVLDIGHYCQVKLRAKGHLSDYHQMNAEDGESLIQAIFNSMAAQSGQSTFNPQARNDARIVRRDFLPPDVHSVRLHTEPIQSSSERNAGQGTLLAMRLLYDSTKASGSLENRLLNLGYLEEQTKVIRNLTQYTGMKLIAGPTGSGKSTALKHIMESMVAESGDKSYLSVEDPPEYPIRGVAQIQVTTNQNQASNWEERGRMYTDAIAGAMRSDPDVIMIGEIRYPEAAVAAIDAALTGHSVWGTIHASDAFTIVTRLESMLRRARVEAPLEVICDSNVLSGLVYQHLIALLCPECKIRYSELTRKKQDEAIPFELYRRLSALNSPVVSFTEEDFNNICIRGKGCKHCNHSGFAKMTVAAETVKLDAEILWTLRAGDKRKARQIWMRKGGISYVDHAAMMIKRGLMDPVIAESRLGDPLTLAQTLYRREGEE